jgi:hypothetical protein
MMFYNYMGPIQVNRTDSQTQSRELFYVIISNTYSTRLGQNKHPQLVFLPDSALSKKFF